MTGQTLFPGADHTSAWYEPAWPGSVMPHPNTLLLHSTESPRLGWPTYDWGQGPGEVAPTLTYDPARPAGQRWRQHFPLNVSARGLVHTGDPATNTLNVVQVEIVGTCNPAWEGKADYTWVPGLTGEAVADLAALLAFLHAEWSVPLTAAQHWKPYPASGGADPGTRMTGPEWVAFSGVCGHEHCPENTHGDPGGASALVDLVLAAAGGAQRAKSLASAPVMLGIYDVLGEAMAREPKWAWIGPIRDAITANLGAAPAPGDKPVIRGVSSILAEEHHLHPAWTQVGTAIDALAALIQGK